MEQIASRFNLPAPFTPAECERYDTHIRPVVKLLNVRTPASYSEHQHILENFPPGSQTLCHAIALSALSSAPETAKDEARTAELYTKSLEFIQTFDPIQVRYVGREWRRVLEFTLRHASSSHAQDPFSAVIPVREAILRLDPTGSLLTSSHILFLQHCLGCKAFSLATPLLDKDIFHIPSPADEKLARQAGVILCNPANPPNVYITAESGLTDKLAIRQVLEYFLYGAMIYMGVGNWKRAIHFLNVVLRAPARRSVSKVQVEAYKKWIMANLIENGTVPDIHKDVTKHISSYMSPLARPYETVAEFFHEGDYTRLTREVEAGKDIWKKDCNASLMEKVAFAYRKHGVIKLGSVIAAIPVPALAKYVHFKEDRMEEFLENLIQQGHLKASLTAPDASSHSSAKILRFDPGTQKQWSTMDKASKDELARSLCDVGEQMATMKNHLNGMRKKLGLSGEYAEALRKIERLNNFSSSFSGNGNKLAEPEMPRSLVTLENYPLREELVDAFRYLERQ